MPLQRAGSISSALSIERPAASRGHAHFARLPCLSFAAALTAAAPVAAQAQNTVKGPTKILIGFAGSSLDAVARTIANKIRESQGQPVIVEAKPGGSGRVAAEALRSAAPDGTTLLPSPAVVHVLGRRSSRRRGLAWTSRESGVVAAVVSWRMSRTNRSCPAAKPQPRFGNNSASAYNVFCGKRSSG